MNGNDNKKNGWYQTEEPEPIEADLPDIAFSMYGNKTKETKEENQNKDNE